MLKTLKLLCFFFIPIVANSELVPRPYYKRVGLKTNLIANFSIGLEAPVYKRFTAEVFARGYQISSGSLNEGVMKSNLRLNIKYQIPNVNGFIPVLVRFSACLQSNSTAYSTAYSTA